MAYALKSFTISNDDGTLPTTCTTAPADLNVGGVNVPLAVLPDHRDAILQLLSQPRTDGEIDLTKQVTGGPLVTFAMPDPGNPALDTIVLAPGLAPMLREKVDDVSGYVAALLAYGLILPA